MWRCGERVWTEWEGGEVCALCQCVSRCILIFCLTECNMQQPAMQYCIQPHVIINYHRLARRGEGPG